jgi:hypothetical protein
LRLSSSLPPYTAAPIPQHKQEPQSTHCSEMTVSNLAGIDLLGILETGLSRKAGCRGDNPGVGAMRRRLNDGAAVILPALRVRT